MTQFDELAKLAERTRHATRQEDFIWYISETRPETILTLHAQHQKLVEALKEAQKDVCENWCFGDKHVAICAKAQQALRECGELEEGK